MSFFFFSSRRRHTRSLCDWSSDVCSSDLGRRVRSGVLLRGDHLDDVTDDDLRVLRDEVGLRGIVDLRTATEAPEAKEWVGSLGIARLHLPLVDMTGTTDPKQLRAEFGDDVAGVYRRMLEEAAPELVAILQF